MQNECPQNLHYTKSHEWVREENGGAEVTIGITAHAQSQLGELVFVDLPEVGKQVAVGEETAVVESVKTAADVYAPVAGEVVAVNELLSDAPDLVNSDPYGQGWLYRVKVAAKPDLKSLLSAEEYQELVK